MINTNNLFTYSLYILLFLSLSVHSMDEKIKILFRTLVNQVKQDCINGTLSETGFVALVNIAHNSDGIVHRDMDLNDYSTFQQLNLTAVLEQIPSQFPHFLNPYFPDSFLKKENVQHDVTLKNLTNFRAVKGRLALHNTSVTYGPGEKPLFENIPDEKLDYERELQCLVCALNEQKKIDKFKERLLEEEICLRNNQKKPGEQKIIELQVTSPSRNCIIADTAKRMRQKQQQSQISNNKEDSTPLEAIQKTTSLEHNKSSDTPNHTSSMIPTNPTKENNEQSQIPVIEKKDTESNTEKIDRNIPFYRKPWFIVSGICICICIAIAAIKAHQWSFNVSSI